jgi:hypothetical protein
MKLDKNLNLVVPIETEAGTVHVHSMPIRRETFEQFFLVLSKTLNSIYTEGLQNVIGPRIAALMLREQARNIGISDEKLAELFDEIRRLSNAYVRTADGWQQVGLANCVLRGYLTEDEMREAEGFIVFFTCIWHIHRKHEVLSFLQPMKDLWDVQTTSLNATAYRDSLPTLTEIETSEPLPPSSIPM